MHTMHRRTLFKNQKCNSYSLKTLDIVNIMVERVKNRDFKPFIGPRLVDKGVLYAHFSGNTSLYAFLSDLAKPSHVPKKEK